MAKPEELRWECPNCEYEVEQSPCPHCGEREVESVWSDGVRIDAHDSTSAVTERP